MQRQISLPIFFVKKEPHPHPARKRMPSFVTGPNRQPPSSSQTAGERSQPAHIAACSLAYHIPSKRRRNNNLARKTTRTAARETANPSLISHLLGDILLRRRHIFLVQIRQKPRSRQQGSLHQRVLCRNLCLRSLACRPLGSHPRLADATAEVNLPTPKGGGFWNTLCLPLAEGHIASTEGSAENSPFAD